MKKTGCLKMILGTFLVLALLLGLSCSKREYHKYSTVEEKFAEFSLLARLMGTYHRHEKILVREPYRLFMSVRPRDIDNFQINNIVLSDLRGKYIFITKKPKLNWHPASQNSSAFFFFEKKGLNLEYEEYDLSFDVLQDGVLLESVNLRFKKNYSEQWMNNWWEDTSSI